MMRRLEFDCGCTRFVILTKKWAIKVPNFKYGWRAFLQGLLANMTERHLSSVDFGAPKICPVLLADPLGFILVMPRCEMLDRELTDEEFAAFFGVEWRGDKVNIPVEDKRESFGRLNGIIVAIDYGN